MPTPIRRRPSNSDDGDTTGATAERRAVDIEFIEALA
jgi:hypothetical protein